MRLYGAIILGVMALVASKTGAESSGVGFLFLASAGLFFLHYNAAGSRRLRALGNDRCRVCGGRGEFRDVSMRYPCKSCDGTGRRPWHQRPSGSRA